MTGFLAVAAGGAVGAAARYAVSLIPVKSGFPILTLITNILGALLIGFIVGTAEKHEVPAWLMLFLKTGVCGGFTTFSTFSLEALGLMEKKEYAAGALYIILSVGLCILGVMCGKAIAAKCRI